jgi:hypothetical protein
MPKYRIAKVTAYRDGKLYKAGQTIVLPEGTRPHASFIPLDDAAKADHAKHHPDAPKPAEAVGPKPAAKAEAAPADAKKRASDKSPL